MKIPVLPLKTDGMLVLFIINSNVTPKQPNIKEIYTNKSFFYENIIQSTKNSYICIIK